MFVEAGAGTGKTSELVLRLLALVESGRTEIAQVAAITFTEAAAADLRARVHLELVRRARFPENNWARQALGGLDEASMTTIHGFAQRILGEHALAAGLPLRFRVLDEIESQLEFEKRFSAFIEALVSDDDEGELIAAARVVGTAMDTLQLLAEEVDDSWDRHRDQEVRPLSLAELRAEVEATAGAIADAMVGLLGIRALCDDRSDLLATAIDGLEQCLGLRSPTDDWIDRLEWCSSAPKLDARVGKKSAWGGIAVEQARALAAEVERVRVEGVARVCGLVLDAVVSRFAREAVLAADARRRNGELRFHDLLVFANHLLSSNEEVRTAVSGAIPVHPR